MLISIEEFFRNGARFNDIEFVGEGSAARELLDAWFMFLLIGLVKPLETLL